MADVDKKFERAELIFGIVAAVGTQFVL